MHDRDPRTAAPVTWLVAAIGVAAAAAAAQVGADARWLAAMGGTIVRTGAIPSTIPYAAAPSHWHDAPALGQLVFYALERHFGDGGLVFAQFVAVAVALSALVLGLRRSGARDGVSALVLLAVFVAAPAAFIVVRAELFSLALFPVLVLLLRGESVRASRRIWLVVPLLALWANLHGGVLVGFAVLGAYVLLRRLRHARGESLAVLGASTLGLFATPAGLAGASYYAGVLRGEAAAQHYGMWAPLSPHSPLDVVFVVLAVPLLVAALRRRPAVWEAAVLLGLVLLSVESRRNGLWLVLFAATPAARSFGRTSGRPLVTRRIALACCALPALVLATGFSKPAARDGAGDGMVRRAAVLAHGSPILADPLVAEQLALDGERIWIGNPLDAFSHAEQRLYLRWLRGEPAGDRIVHAPVRVVLVERGSVPQKRLAALHRLREIARDARTVLYVASR